MRLLKAGTPAIHGGRMADLRNSMLYPPSIFAIHGGISSGELPIGCSTLQTNKLIVTPLKNGAQKQSAKQGLDSAL